MEKSRVKNIIVIAACLILGVVFVVASYMVLNFKIKDKTNIVEYECIGDANTTNLTREDLFNGSYLLYLVVNYSDEDYNAEIERLKSVKAEYPDAIKNPLYNKSDNPAYITIFDGNGSYEYALLDSKNKTIAYVFNQLFEWKEIEINENYMLKNYSVNSNDKDINQNGYNMYYIYDKNGIGTSFNEI